MQVSDSRCNFALERLMVTPHTSKTLFNILSYLFTFLIYFCYDYKKANHKEDKRKGAGN